MINVTYPCSRSRDAKRGSRQPMDYVGFREVSA